jgi:DNA polymerase III delta subunit
MINVYVGKQKKPIVGERVDLLSANITLLFDEIQTPSLFGEKKTFVLMNVMENDSIKKEVLERLAELEETPHDVAIVVDSMLAADVKKFEKVGTIHKSLEKEKKAEAFNPFGLANAFATGDKKKTWLAFQEVLAHEDEMEKTHGMIWWKLKDMMTKKSSVPKEKLDAMARRLVSIYHESRLGGLGMKERLEEFFLTLDEK